MFYGQHHLLLFVVFLCLCWGINGIRAEEEREIHCVKWRATKNCDPAGPRVSSQDKSCDATITKDMSGFCECENRRRVREVGCDHHPFTCQQACTSDASADLTVTEGFEYVTCGSTIKLVHEESRFRLHSHGLSWGTGSQQQAVTADGSRNDPGSYWLVKEADNDTPCSLGKKIPCDSEIRLEHVDTKKNLHTHNYRSPLSRNFEVSGFGVAGEGDRGDTWILKCQETQQCDVEGNCEQEQVWKREQLVQLLNTQTGVFLQTNYKNRFDENNCGGCPILGQLEVSAAKKSSDDALWFASEGIYFAPLE